MPSLYIWQNKIRIYTPCSTWIFPFNKITWTWLHATDEGSRTPFSQPCGLAASEPGRGFGVFTEGRRVTASESSLTLLRARKRQVKGWILVPWVRGSPPTADAKICFWQVVLSRICFHPLLSAGGWEQRAVLTNRSSTDGHRL